MFSVCETQRASVPHDCLLLCRLHIMLFSVIAPPPLPLSAEAVYGFA